MVWDDLLSCRDRGSDESNVIDTRSFGYINAVRNKTEIQALVALDEHHPRGPGREDRLQPACQVGLLHVGPVDPVRGLIAICAKDLEHNGTVRILRPITL